jgi:hypothetical protein
VNVGWMTTGSGAGGDGGDGGATPPVPQVPTGMEKALRVRSYASITQIASLAWPVNVVLSHSMSSSRVANVAKRTTLENALSDV